MRRLRTLCVLTRNIVQETQEYVRPCTSDGLVERPTRWSATPAVYTDDARSFPGWTDNCWHSRRRPQPTNVPRTRRFRLETSWVPCREDPRCWKGPKLHAGLPVRPSRLHCKLTRSAPATHCSSRRRRRRRLWRSWCCGWSWNCCLSRSLQQQWLQLFRPCSPSTVWLTGALEPTDAVTNTEYNPLVSNNYKVIWNSTLRPAAAVTCWNVSHIMSSNWFCPYGPLCENVTSSTKPEVHNIVLSSEKDRTMATGNMYRTFREV